MFNLNKCGGKKMSACFNARKSGLLSGFKFFLLSFLFLFLITIPLRGEELTNLSSAFIDPQSSPLIIYGQVFPVAVIYQNNTMYAPVQDFLSMIGISSNLQGLPGYFILNGKTAPLSLLGIGEDRNTGESIYYLNVTATLDLVGGAPYKISDDGGQIRITIAMTAYPPSSPPSNVGGGISGQVLTARTINEGYVTLSMNCLNDSGIQETRVIETVYLTPDGKFSFQCLWPGEYTVTGKCTSYYTTGLEFDPAKKRHYYYCTTYTTALSQNIKIEAGKVASLILNGGEEISSGPELIYYSNPAGMIWYPKVPGTP